MSDKTDNPSPGLAVFRALHPGERDALCNGSTAFRCDNIAEAAIEASGLRARIMHLEERYAVVLVHRDRLAVALTVARTTNNPSDVFVEIYASLLAGMAASSLWSANVGAGVTSMNHRDDLANAAYEMAEAAVRRLEKGAQ